MLKNEKYVKALLDISKRDLEAAKILYENKLYPQAIFYLQQSIEKSTKCAFLSLGIIDVKDLRKISHNVVIISQKLFEKASERLKWLENLKDPKFEKKALEIFKKFKNVFGESFTIEEIERFRENIETYKRKLEKLSKAYSNASELASSLKDSDVVTALRQANSHLKELEKLKNQNIDITDKDALEFRNEMLKVIREIKNEFKNYLSPQEIEAENKIKKLDIYTIKEFLEESSKLGLLLGSLSKLIEIFYSLATPIYFHASLARYPRDNFNPLEFYTEDYPLVKYFNSIVKVQEKALECFDEVLDRLSNFNRYVQN